METRRAALAALILALPAASAHAQSGGLSPVPKDFIGPLAPNQCYAGSAGCPPLDGKAKIPLADAMDPATESASMDIGRQQMMDSVKKDEDGMLQSGVYKAIDRTPDGKGAVITLPNGSVMWSDYVQGFDTMPQKTPQALLAMLKDKGLDPKTLAAVQKTIDDKAAKNSDQDQKQLAAAEAKMFGGSDPSKRGASGAPATAAPDAEQTGGTGGTDAGAGAPGADMRASAYGLGPSSGQTGLPGGTGAGASGTGGSVPSAGGYAGTAAPTAPATITADGLTHKRLIDWVENVNNRGRALLELQDAAHDQPAPSDEELRTNGNVNRGGATVNGQ